MPSTPVEFEDKLVASVSEQKAQKKDAAERRKFQRDFRNRRFFGEVQFDLKIEILGSEFVLPIRASYEYLPEWSVFNARTGREMCAVHRGFTLLRMNMMTPSKALESKEVEIGHVLWDGELISQEASDKLSELVDRDAKRKDTETRAEFARKIGAKVIKFPGQAKSTMGNKPR